MYNKNKIKKLNVHFISLCGETIDNVLILSHFAFEKEPARFETYRPLTFIL